MSTTKKNIKVRDLKPSKDAKGGAASRNAVGLNAASHNAAGRNAHGLEGHNRNTKHQNLGTGGHR